MNRRILDNVAITALSKHGDEALTKSICDMFGTGTLVDNAKTNIISFGKSMLGLTPTNISNIVRKLAIEFNPDSSICNVVDSNGTSHVVSRETISILKALALYRVTCPAVISDCLGNLFLEVDNYFKGETSNKIVTVVVETFDTTVHELKYENLMECCRQEVFGLLREGGVSIG